MGQRAHKSIVVIFAREPILGTVKTRLAAGVGDCLALSIYRAFLADLLGHLPTGSWEVRVAVAGDPQSFAESFGLDPLACFAQEGGDLGERMDAAFQRVLGEGLWDRCLLVGADMPHLEVSALALADAALAMGEADVVLGPALDGGYYLVAMARPYAIFSEIDWSTDVVLKQTRARVQKMGLRTKLLPPSFDVDTVADLDRLAAWLAGREPGVLPHTRAVLAEYLRA